MQKTPLILGLVAVSLAVTGFSATSFAAREKATPEQRAERMIKRLDGNGDNKVSLEEMQTRTSVAFKTFDADGNGEVSRDEIKAKRAAFREARKEWREAKAKTGAETPAAEKTAAMEKLKDARPAMLPGMRGKGFARADIDKSGSLSLSEVAGVTEKMFKHRDKNADGFIDASDFKKTL